MNNKTNQDLVDEFTGFINPDADFERCIKVRKIIIQK